ncbi:MAG: hypothetical protein ACJAT4_000280 [Granulosicoccus sp.]|jgi:hypothetical protein
MLERIFCPHFSLYSPKNINIYVGNKAKAEHKTSLSETATYLIRITMRLLTFLSVRECKCLDNIKYSF